VVKDLGHVMKKWIIGLLIVLVSGCGAGMLVTAMIEIPKIHHYSYASECLKRLCSKLSAAEMRKGIIGEVQDIHSVTTDERVLVLCSDLNMKVKWLNTGVCVCRGNLLLLAIPSPSGTMSVDWESISPLSEQLILANTYSPTNGLTSVGDITAFKLEGHTEPGSSNPSSK
jgi:hypothetical protein